MSPIASRQFESGRSSWRVSVDEGGAAFFGCLDEVPGPRTPGLRFFNAATGESRFLPTDITAFRSQEALDRVSVEQLTGWLERATPVG